MKEIADFLRMTYGVVSMLMVMKLIERALYGKPRPIPKRGAFDSRRVASLQSDPEIIRSLRFMLNVST